jgi:hypothetical protein
MDSEEKDSKQSWTTWKIYLATPYKNISGHVTTPGKWDNRTTSLLNNDYKDYVLQKNKADLPLEGFVELHDVTVFNFKEKIAEYPNYFIRKEEIIYAFDDFKRMALSHEATRVYSRYQGRIISITTKCIDNSSFIITGSIINFKHKYKSSRFIPIANVSIQATSLSTNKNMGKPLELPFVAFNRDFINGYSVLSPLDEEISEESAAEQKGDTSESNS